MLIRFAEAEDLRTWKAISGTTTTPFCLFTNAEEFSGVLANTCPAEYEALAAIDYRSGDNLGIIAFSRRENHIGGFAVKENSFSGEAGSRLLKTALRHLDAARPVTVKICASLPPAPATRALYEKYGFIEQDGPLLTPLGHPACQMVLPPSGEKRGKSFHYRYPPFI